MGYLVGALGEGDWLTTVSMAVPTQAPRRGWSSRLFGICRDSRMGGSGGITECLAQCPESGLMNGHTERSATVVTVIVPAHNEEAVLGASLAALTASSPSSHIGLRILVVCNGCTDGTAATAREVVGVTVLESEVPSKVRAINLGFERAPSGPVIVMDADIRLRGAGVVGLLAALQRPGVLAAAPRVLMDFARGTPWSVRAFYRLWLALPYVAEGMVGCGVYALNEAGRRRVGELPDIIADDGFVRMCFTASERVRVDETIALVRAPRTWCDLIRIKTRSRLGGYQLGRLDDARLRRDDARSGRWSAWLTVLRSPSLWPCVPVYLLVNLVARARARRQLKRSLRGGAVLKWERDESARSAAREGLAR